jgi:hypothetical protein
VSEIKTRPLSREFSEGFDRIFKQREANKGGRWVYDTAQKKLVPASEYHAALAVNAPVMAGRFYENQSATDGTDIGSRRKHRDYMRANGLTTADDYTQTWKKKAEERAAWYTQGGDAATRKQRREDVARAWHERTR